LFFEWIKQHLRIKRFLATSENAVKTQNWCAAATCVLIAIVKKEMKLDASLYTCLQILSVSIEEMKMAVDEAHRAGRKVAAHAHGTQGIKDAVRAGVDSLEHGSLIDAEGIDMMKARGAYLVADIYNDDYILGKAVEFGLPKESVGKLRAPPISRSLCNG
jgi:imidazolonepropionase-like amidohydrolase